MKKEQIYVVQGAMAAVGAWFSAKLGILFPILVVFSLMMVIDQLSGMLASKKEALDHPEDKTKGWSSVKWRKGIYKKFGYILTVAVAMVIDYIVLNVAEQFGVNIPTTTLFGLLTSVWFILNELLSILENAGRMGAALPEFLKKVICVLKTGVEKAADGKQ